MKILQAIVVFIFFLSLIKSEETNTTVSLSVNISDSRNSSNETNETHHSSKTLIFIFLRLFVKID